MNDGSKLLVVQALQRAAKNFESEEMEILEKERDPDENNEHVDLGIFGDFWLQKPFSGGENSEKSTRPTPVFRKEDYLDKFPELLVQR